MWTAEYLYVPAALAGVLFFVGFAGPWRRLIGCVVCTYAAIVIASQHYVALTSFAARQFGLAESSLSWTQQSNLVFAIVLVGLCVGLLALYGTVWRPREEAANGSGWSKLLRGLICALTGWVVGSILLAAILTTSGIELQARPTDATIERGVVFGANEVTGHLVRPWVPGELPPVLQ